MKPEILHISTYLQGGAGLVLKNLAIDQQHQGYNVCVVASKTPYAGYENYAGYIEALREQTVEVHLIDSLFKRDKHLNQAVEDYLVETIDLSSLRIVHSHAAIPSWIAKRVTDRKGLSVPIIQTMQGWGQNKTLEQERQDVGIMNQLDGVVAVSEASRHLLIQKGVDASLIEVIPNGVESHNHDAVRSEDLDRINDLRKRTQFLVGCFGSICDRKNQKVLIESIVRLREAGINAGVLFIGEQDPSYQLDAIVRKYQAEDAVLLLGYRSSARSYLKYVDLYCLPSKSEGLPLSLLECFCDGVLTIGSRIPSIEEIIDDGINGFLFDHSNADDLSDVIQKWVEMNPKAMEKMVSCSRNLYHQTYSLDTLIERYNAYYEKVSLSRS